MNITPKLDHISTDFITQYLTSLGIDNIKSYLKPTKSCFEKWNKYSNIERACEFLKTYYKISLQGKNGISFCTSRNYKLWLYFFVIKHIFSYILKIYLPNN